MRYNLSVSSQTGNTRCDRVSGGFSLVELLIVIAVIAILVAMLLSVMRMVRGGAENTQCINALRQFGVAHMSYASDYRGVIVPTCEYVGGDQYNWSRILLSYMEQDPLMRTDVMINDSATRRHLLAHICPAANRFYNENIPTWQTLAAWNFNQQQWRMTSYGQNLYPLAPESYRSSVTGYNPHGEGWGLFRLPQITEPSRRPLNTEATYTYVTPIPPTTSPEDMRWATPGGDWLGGKGWGPQRHRGGNNSLFFDFHVQALPPISIQAAMADPSNVTF